MAVELEKLSGQEVRIFLEVAGLNLTMDHGLVIPKILNMVRNAALLGIQYEGLDLEKFPVKYRPGGVLVHQAASGHIIWPRNQQMDCQFQQTILHSHWSPYYPYIAVKIA